MYENENRHMFSHVLGYNIRNKKVFVNQQEKELVNKIFDIYLSCKSLNETARHLDKEGYRGIPKEWIQGWGQGLALAFFANLLKSDEIQKDGAL